MVSFVLPKILPAALRATGTAIPALARAAPD
jgi:hypothetical protein